MCFAKSLVEQIDLEIPALFGVDPDKVPATTGEADALIDQLKELRLLSSKKQRVVLKRNRIAFDMKTLTKKEANVLLLAMFERLSGAKEAAGAK